MISLHGVHKRFGDRVAVHPMDLEVPRGVICGLLGHNGAGKSTLIGMLLGQVFPDAGTVRVRDCDVRTDRARALERVGAIFESPAFYDYLSGERNLRLFCEYSRVPDPSRLAEAIRLVGLEDRIQDKVATYSHGMRQRLALAQALLPEPELLILDEPSQGLDPEGIHDMRALILKLNRELGLTILFSSHLLGEVEATCSHLAIVHHGRLLFAGAWRRGHEGAAEVGIRVDRQAEAEAALAKAALVSGFPSTGRAVLAEGVTLTAVAKWLADHGFLLQSITPIERTLEEFYLATIRKGEASRER